MPIKAVIFDLDGTITQPVLDFDAIRAEIGEVEGPLLEAISAMSDEKRQAAERILHRHEEIAAEHSLLNPHTYELFDWMRSRSLAVGLVTRNQLKSARRICELHNLTFDTIVTREDGPAKPDPFPVRHACELMRVEPSESVMVGDYIYDLISGRRAGTYSVLLTTSEKHNEYRHEADYVIDSLAELPAVIEQIEAIA